MILDYWKNKYSLIFAPKMYEEGYLFLYNKVDEYKITKTQRIEVVSLYLLSELLFYLGLFLFVINGNYIGALIWFIDAVFYYSYKKYRFPLFEKVNNS